MATALMFVVVVFAGWAWWSQRESTRVRIESQRRASELQRLNQLRMEAIRLHQSATDAPLDDLTPWVAAQVAIQQAQTLMTSETPTDLTNEIQELAGRITSSVQDRQLISNIERAREKSLEQISVLGQPDTPEELRLLKQLHYVFDVTPLLPTSSDFESAKEFIQSMDPAIQEAVIGAIDELFVVSESKSDREWLVNLLSEVDDNQWRINWRNAVLNRDSNQLLQFLKDEVTSRQTNRCVLNLCRSIEEFTNPTDRMEFLRSIAADRMDDFWFNIMLGDCCFESRRFGGLALRSYSRALSARQLGSLEFRVGRTKLGPAWINREILAHVRRAIESNDRSADSWELLGEVSIRLGLVEEARKAYEQRFSLSDEPVRDYQWYLKFLESTGRASDAIDYLRSIQTSNPNSLKLTFTLIELLMREGRFLEVIEECEMVSVWPFEPPYEAPLERIRGAAAAVRASEQVRLKSNKLPDNRRNELLRKSHRWLTQTWVSWELRNTWEKQPVLDEIVKLRDSGYFDAVHGAEALRELPDDLQIAWSDFWADIRMEEARKELLSTMVPEAGKWSVLKTLRITSKTEAQLVSATDGFYSVASAGNHWREIIIEAGLPTTGVSAIRLDFGKVDKAEKNDSGYDEKTYFGEIEFCLQSSASENVRAEPLKFSAEVTWKQDFNVASPAVDNDLLTVLNIPILKTKSNSAVFRLENQIPPGAKGRVILRLFSGRESQNAVVNQIRLSTQSINIE